MCMDTLCRPYAYAPPFFNMLLYWAIDLKNHRSKIACQSEQKFYEQRTSVPTLSRQLQQIIKLVPATWARSQH